MQFRKLTAVVENAFLFNNFHHFSKRFTVYATFAHLVTPFIYNGGGTIMIFAVLCISGRVSKRLMPLFFVEYFIAGYFFRSL